MKIIGQTSPASSETPEMYVESKSTMVTGVFVIFDSWLEGVGGGREGIGGGGGVVSKVKG